MARSHLRLRKVLWLTTSLVAGLWCLPARAVTYHVAQSSGSDSNDGSLAAPFATISACGKVALAGDTCIVHAGTYRETVAPANSGTASQPIVFQVADGECATVTGTEPLTATFAPGQAGNLWTAPVADNVEQLFSNGEMIWEAQWPNRTPGTLFDLPKGIAGQGTGVQNIDGGSQSYLVDPNIPAGDWIGASVFLIPGSRWQSDSRPVQAYDPVTHTITLDTTIPWAETSTQPILGTPYYLYGSKLALDAQDEWVWQAGTLFYYSADDPQNHGLEYKKRSYAFDVTQSYIQIVGFHVFGAAVRFTGNSNTIDSLAIAYSSHLRSFNAYYTEGDVNRIKGDDNTWKNSIVEKSGSAGLIVAGNRNLIQNNIANDVVYQATNQAGFDMNDNAGFQGNLFLFNTVNRSGRGGIFVYGDHDGRVLFNKVTDWALLTRDMGGIYAWGTDGQGTEIAYNEVGGSTAFYSNGIYLDDKTKHFVVHHNFVHDSNFFGFCIKEENDYFNNTTANVGTPFLIDKDFQKGVWTNTKFAKVENHLSDGTLLVRVGVLPTNVTDYGYFEGQVHATPNWQHVMLPFASLFQPGWFVQKPFDLTSIQQLAFTPWTNGDFEFDIDNLQLLGPASLVVDDFETGGGQNGLGGYPWGGGSGDGTTGTIGTLTYASGGATADSTKFARFAGTMVLGDSSWGLMTESVPKKDLSQYSAIAFDIRGQMKGLKVLAAGGNSPSQDHNGSCAFATTTVPACAIEQGVEIPGVTDGFAGSAPDLGAFEATVTPWLAGAQRPADSKSCGKIADITATLPPRYVATWPSDSILDAGVTDGGVPDAAIGNTDGASSGGGSGCTCGVGGKASGSGIWIVLLGLGTLVMRRKRRE